MSRLACLCWAERPPLALTVPRTGDVVLARMSKERRLRGFAPFATQCGRPLYGQNGFYDARATGSTFRSKQPSVDANDAVNLKDGLCDVEADCSDCQHGALLRTGRCMLIAGARGKRPLRYHPQAVPRASFEENGETSFEENGETRRQTGLRRRLAKTPSMPFCAGTQRVSSPSRSRRSMEVRNSFRIGTSI